MELSAALPREIGTTHDRYQYMERQLKNDKTDVDATIKPYALEVIKRLAARGETIVLQMDQSHINAVNEVLMLSVRLRKRALPVAWRVRSTQGNIGFGVQKDMLDSVKAWLTYWNVLKVPQHNPLLNVFPEARMAPYHKAGDGFEQAFAHYQWNIRLAEAMLPTLHYLEVFRMVSDYINLTAK